MAKDFYKILGVSREADEKEIKRAYRKLARQHHPDINPNDATSEARFKEINEAYQVLSDSEKRALYDQFGDDYDKVPAGAAAYGPNFSGARGGNGGGYNASDFSGINFEEIFGASSTRGGPKINFQSGGGNASDLFENFFGGRGGSKRSRGPERGGDVEQPIDISLAESIHGTQRSLKLTIRGQGHEEQRNVTVKIPAGVQEGARVRVANQGASGSGGGPNGDLYLKIHIQPHAFWRREGDNLHCEVPVKFSEAALGSTIRVPTLEGEVNLKIPAGTQSGQTIRLSGRGVKSTKSGKAGDQFVKVKVAVPRELSERERELVEELSQLRGEDVRRDLPKAL